MFDSNNNKAFRDLQELMARKMKLVSEQNASGKKPKTVTGNESEDPVDPYFVVDVDGPKPAQEIDDGNQLEYPPKPKPLLPDQDNISNEDLPLRKPKEGSKLPPSQAKEIGKYRLKLEPKKLGDENENLTPEQQTNQDEAIRAASNTLAALRLRDRSK